MKVAVIGCGRIGALLEDDPLRYHPCTHLGAWMATSDVEVVGACDLKEDRLLYCRERFGVKKLYTDYRQMLAVERPDIVSIASDTETHAEILAACVEAGVKGVFLEKPVASSSAELASVLPWVNGTVVVVNHERRWEAPYNFVKNLVAGGFLGRVLKVEGRVCSNYKGDILLHDGTHLIDMIRYIAGEFEDVSGRKVGRDFYGSFTIELPTGGKAYGTIEASFRPYFEFELKIWGTEGMVAVGNSGLELYRVGESNRFYGFKELHKIGVPQIRFVNPFLLATRELIRAVEEGADVRSTLLDGLEALRVIEAFEGVYASI